MSTDFCLSRIFLIESIQKVIDLIFERTLVFFSFFNFETYVSHMI